MNNETTDGGATVPCISLLSQLVDELLSRIDSHDSRAKPENRVASGVQIVTWRKRKEDALSNTERRGASSRPSGADGSEVVTELNALREWIKDESNYRREDAVDEISRAIVNRINQIKSSGWNPPNND